MRIARGRERIGGLASYTTLPAGVYTLRVQGSTSRGPWSEPGAALRIKIGATVVGEPYGSRRSSQS